MKFYCMCQITGDVPPLARDSQGFGPLDNQVFGALNRFGKFEKAEEFRSVILRRPMIRLKAGVSQRITDSPVPNIWAKTAKEYKEDTKSLLASVRNYPDVDLYRCPICGAMLCIKE